MCVTCVRVVVCVLFLLVSNAVHSPLMRFLPFCRYSVCSLVFVSCSRVSLYRSSFLVPRSSAASCSCSCSGPHRPFNTRGDMTGTGCTNHRRERGQHEAHGIARNDACLRAHISSLCLWDARWCQADVSCHWFRDRIHRRCALGYARHVMKSKYTCHCLVTCN